MNDPVVREVLLIDDDEVSRELLMLLMAESGFHGIEAESGDAALLKLKALDCKPFAALVDMQMHGTTGNALARELHTLCEGTTRLIAMSGSAVQPEHTRDFDGFLRKPFTVGQLWAALGLAEERSGVELEANAPAGSGAEVEALSEATFAHLANSMPPAQLLKLYGMCLDDAERRIGLMRIAVAAGDADAYERAAHAIKGGCGMVGATELAGIAGLMEQNGTPADGNIEPIEEFLVAASRLRSILNTRVV